MKRLRDKYSATPELLLFWETLKPAYDFFEKTCRIQVIQVEGNGAFTVRSSKSISKNLKE